MEDIDHYNIPVYNFPYDVEEDDEETIADNSELRVRVLPVPPILLVTDARCCTRLGSTAFCHHWLRGRD